MAGEYRNYKGRRPRGRSLLAVLLILVILGAAMVGLLQKHIVYDELGKPYLDISLQEEPQETDPELNLVIRGT